MRAFAPMTAALLARKGETRPLDGARTSVARREPQPYFAISTDAPKPGTAPRADVIFAPAKPSTAVRSHRISLTLSEAEFETLGIVSVKKAINRQRLLRLAVDSYLAKLADQYRSDCHCISENTNCCGGKAD
jgi:hypothetical protein